MKYFPFAILCFSAAVSLRADTVTLIPSADTFVKNSDLTSDFGDDANFIANNANGVRVSYLRFDLSSTVGQTITSAQLNATVSNAATGNLFNVYGLITGENWVEKGAGRLVWNANAPGIIATHAATTGTLPQYLNPAAFYLSEPLAGFTSTAAVNGTDTVFDVSSGTLLDFINADADRIVTFVIAEQDPSDNSGNGWFSRDAANPAQRPALTVTTQMNVWAHYPFDLDAYDVSGNNRHGSFVDVAVTGNSGITTSPGSFKMGEGALSLSADRDYLAIPSKTYNSGSSYSIAFWAKKSTGDAGGASSWDMVIGQRDTTTNFIALNDVTGAGLRWRGASGAAECQSDFAVPKDYQWHHYVLVASGTTISLYLDGQFFGSATGKQTGIILNTIGEAYTAASDFDFNGQLDEMWIFDEALDANAVSGLYQSNNPSATPTPDPITRVRIILQGGQSNSDGRAAVSGLPVALQTPQADVDFFYRIEGGAGALTTLRPGLSETAQFGPEITLGRNLADFYAEEPGTRVAIIKYANGGTNLHTQWKAGGDATTSGDGPEYVTFQQTVTAGWAALAAKYPQAALELDSMVWMQGESDATATQAMNYQTNLTNFIADLRLTYGASLPFVLGRLSSQQTNLNATCLNQVRAAQDAVAAADPRTTAVATEGFGLSGDNLHFNASGQQSLGSAFAQDSAYGAWIIVAFPASDIDTGKAEPGADPDGDGLTNLSEFLGGTDPRSATP